MQIHGHSPIVEHENIIKNHHLVKFQMVNSFVNNVSVNSSKLQNDYAIDLKLTWIKEEEKPILCSDIRVGMLIQKSFF